MNVETVVIPALAIVTSAWTAVAALRHQRIMAEEARLWERRATLYVDLLANQRPYLAEADMDPAVRPYFGAQTPEERQLLESLSSRVDAFASEAVAELWRKAMYHVYVVSSFVSEGMSNPMNPTPEDEEQIAPLLAAREEAVGTLREQIRKELKTSTRRRRLRIRRRQALPGGQAPGRD
ncbi:hypothetical protein [Streptomyces sp. enrichment culture]|uniref:hypothetical protein n=1 Tax=Streptomyces sp. enrichment culture TaxID=1795815 RepID=UPI003F550205